MSTGGTVQRLRPVRRVRAMATRLPATRPFAREPEGDAVPATRGFDFARVSVQALERPGGLPAPLRVAMERLSGVRLDDVRVHRDSRAPEGVEALAYAQGRDIHLAPGQEHHLPHEAWHVVQQKRGRVRANLQVAGKPVNEHEGLEREAREMGERALRASPVSAGPASAGSAGSPAAAPVSSAGAVQRAKRKQTSRKKKAPRRRKTTTAGISKPKTQRMRGKYQLGMHGAKKSEQKRLKELFGKIVSGSTHESEHTIGFEPLNQTSGLKRGSPGRARELEFKAPAYQEVKEFHRDHIGTGTTNQVDDSGFNSHTYRQAQRSLLESGDVSSAVQINQLGYSFMKGFGNLPTTSGGKQSNDSFNQMVGNLQSVTYAQGDNDVSVPVDARQRTEMHLSRMVAQSGKWPSVSEENEVRKLYGLDPYVEKMDEEK